MRPLDTLDEPISTGRRLGVVVLVLIAGGLAINLALVNPIQRYMEDFRAYYAAGWALDRGMNPYDIETTLTKLTLPGEQPVYYYPYPPPSLVVVYPFAKMPYPAAQVPWAVFQLALAVVSLLVLFRALDLPLGSPASVVIGVGLLISHSTFELFRWGQFDFVVLTLLAVATWAMLRERSVLAGVFIGFATLAKVTPIVYLGVFIVRRDVKAIVAAIVTMATLMGASFLWIGDAGFSHWWMYLTEKLGVASHLISQWNCSLHGFFYRAFVEESNFDGISRPWIDLGAGAAKLATYGTVAFLGVVTFAWAVWHRKIISTAECFAAAVPVLLLMAPITWAHHCVALIIPIAMIVAMLARQGRSSSFDLLWVAGILLLWSLRPVQRFQIDIPSQLMHAVVPTTTYAVALTWLYLMTRYVPLKRRADIQGGAGDVAARVS